MRLFNKTTIAVFAIACCVSTAGLAMRDTYGMSAPDDGGSSAQDSATTGSMGNDPVNEYPDSVEVTYKLVFGSDTVKTFTTRTKNHTATRLPDSLSLGTFATFSYDKDSVNSLSAMDVVATINWNADAPIHITMPGEKPIYHSLHIGNNATDVYFSYSETANPNIVCTRTQPEGDGGMWAFYGNPYRLVVKNKAAGEGVRLASPRTDGTVVNNGETSYAVLTSDFAAYPDSVWRFLPADTTHNGQRMNIAGGFFLENAQGHKLNLRNNGRGGDYHLAYWTAGFDRGSVLIPVRPNKTVTYNISLDGKLIKTVRTSSPIGAAAAVPANLSLGNLASFAYSPDSISDNTTEVNVTMTWSPYAPLQLSAPGDMHYYNLYISTGNGARYINYKEGTSPNISMDTAAKGDSCQWAFVGSPYELKLVNKAAGDTLWLSSPRSSSTKGNQSGGDIRAVLSNDTVANPDYVWHLFSATQDMNGHAVTGGGVYLENKEGHRLNYRSPNLAYWNGGYDQGSAVLIRQTNNKADIDQPTLADGVYRISTTDNSGEKWAAMSDGKLAVGNDKPAADADWHGLFLVRHTGNAGSKTYSIQSLESGAYLNKQGSAAQQVGSGSGAYDFTLKLNSEIDTTANGLWWNVYNDASATADGLAVWHADASGKVVVWRVPSGGKPGTSDWRFERDTTFSTKVISERLSSFTGIVDKPVAGNIYRIVNVSYGRALFDDYMHTDREWGTAVGNSYNLYQYWLVEDAGSGKIRLRNLLTGKYPNGGSYGGYYSMTANKNGAKSFGLNAKAIDAYTTCYYLKDGGNSVHCSASQNYATVIYTDIDPNRWYFVRINESDTLGLAKERANYLLRTDIRDNAGSYGKVLGKYFNDNACTKLKPEYQSMDDDDLRETIGRDSLPAVLVDMVFKIKNNGWEKYKSGRNWEQMFREHEYQPQTDCDGYKWSSQMGIGYLWGNQTGPSGIAVEGGEQIVYVFVDSVPANSYVAAELIPVGSNSGPMTKLKQGMNAILTNGSASNINVRYWCSTDNGGKYDGKGKTLADFKPVMVHIEGGKVNGCFDLTREMNDSTWVDMVNDGLVWAPGFNMRGYYAALHVRSGDIKWGKPADGSQGSITTLMKTFDDVVRIENELEGFTTDSIGSKCFNGILEANSVDRGYFASTYGCYIDHGSMRGLLRSNYANPGEGLWGPAHEWGHNHQQHILMCGSTEQSNNLFSNVVIYKLTNQTSRGAGTISTRQVAGYYNSGLRWYQYGTWPYTQMLWKLYLYYHVAENDTTFYQKVFRLMRDKYPLTGRWNTTTGDKEYLRFAVACSEAAGENLEDFFRVWGFFHYPIDVTVGDYRNTRMTTTKEMVDWALGEMRKYPRKGGNNIIFIDDHIKPLMNKVKDNVYYGKMRTHNTDDPNKFGQMGDFGSWDSFLPDSAGWTRASLKEVRENQDGGITYVTEPASHVVGYKVYNSKGELVWFANTKTFEVPANVVSRNGGKDSLFFTACAANGTEDYVGAVKVDVDETGYTTLYYGDRNLRVPAGVEAQTYRLNSESKLVKTNAYVSGKTIPHGTGVVIQAKAGTYRFEEVKADGIAEQEEGSPIVTAMADDKANMLHGTDTTALTTIDENAIGYKFYKLSVDTLHNNTSIGFYWVVDNGGAFVNDAHKAYLASPAQTSAQVAYPFSEAGDVTGITGVTTDIEKGKRQGTYNLSGQRVSDQYRGIVIQDGKKVLRK